MSSVGRWWIFLVVLLWSVRAGAEEQWTPHEPVDPRPHHGAMFGIGTMFLSPSLGNTTFRGDGVPVYGGTAGFDHTGREMGVSHPALLAGEMRIAYVRRYFEIGAHAFMGGSIDDGGAGVPSVRPLVDPGKVGFIGAGGHVVGVIPVRGFSFTFGPDVGARVFDVPITGFQRYECQTRAGKQQCTQQASAAQLYVEPRFGVLLNTGSFARALEDAGLFVHAWIGGDVLTTSSLAFGLTIGAAFNHEAMAP